MSLLFIGTSHPGLVAVSTIQAVEVRRRALDQPCRPQIWVKAPDPQSGELAWGMVLERYVNDFLGALAQGEARRQLEAWAAAAAAWDRPTSGAHTPPG